MCAPNSLVDCTGLTKLEVAVGAVQYARSTGAAASRPDGTPLDVGEARRFVQSTTLSVDVLDGCTLGISFARWPLVCPRAYDAEYGDDSLRRAVSRARSAKPAPTLTRREIDWAM